MGMRSCAKDADRFAGERDARLVCIFFSPKLMRPGQRTPDEVTLLVVVCPMKRRLPKCVQDVEDVEDLMYLKTSPAEAMWAEGGLFISS